MFHVQQMTQEKPEGYVFGRPTKYRPEMCEKVIEWGRQGKSRAWMCSRLEIGTSTLAVWEAEHQDFREALERARYHAQAHWEDLGHDNIKDREFNASVWSRSMAARFPDEWRESTKNETELKGGVTVSVVSGVPRND